MPISMSTEARYVTQTGIYTNQYKGKLTNRRIAYYQAHGYYGKSGILALSKEKTKKRVTRRLTGVDSILHNLGL
jgi:hypothetical protein